MEVLLILVICFLAGIIGLTNLRLLSNVKNNGKKKGSHQ